MDRSELITGDRLWGARRIQDQTFNRLMAGVALAVSSAWLGWWAAAIALPLLAYVVVRHRTREEKPVVPPGFTLFGGHRFPLTIDKPGDRGPSVLRELADGRGTLDLSVWLVSWDEAGFPWTLIRRTETGYAPTMTMEVTRPGDPFAVTQRNLASALDVATVHARLLESGRDARNGRDVAVFVVECSLSAQQLAQLDLDGDHAVFTEVHPDTVARLMGAAPATEWSGTSALGLVALVEDYYPDSSTQIEGFVEEGWRTARQFGRLENLTERESTEESIPTADQLPAPASTSVVLTVEDGDVVETVRAPRYPTDHVLTWEVPSRAVPNRY